MSNPLSLSRIQCCCDLDSKKSVLCRLADLFEKTSHTVSTDLFEAFMARERLGSTGLGHGVAIPHIRSQTVNSPQIAFLKLNQGIDFDAPDREPVDLIIGIVVPENSHETHLQLLAKIAKLFDNVTFRNNMRSCTQAFELYERLQVQFELDQEPTAA